MPSCRSEEYDQNIQEGDAAALRRKKDEDRRFWLSIVLIVAYILVMAGGVVVIYKAIEDLVRAYQLPVRSINYLKVEEYQAPGRLLYLIRK